MESIKVNCWQDYLEKHLKFTGCLINKYTDIAWYKKGKWHREDGPAVELANGYKEWWLNGIRYNEQKRKIATRRIKWLIWNL